MELNLPLFKDDAGVYVMSPLGCKVYCVEVAPGTFQVKANNGNYFAACASILTVAMQLSIMSMDAPEDQDLVKQYWAKKKPIIDGTPYQDHVPLGFWLGTPGGVLTTSVIASVVELKARLGDAYTAWVLEGKVWVKNKATGLKKSFPSYDDAMAWLSKAQESLALT